MCRSAHRQFSFANLPRRAYAASIRRLIFVLTACKHPTRGDVSFRRFNFYKNEIFLHPGLFLSADLEQHYLAHRAPFSVSRGGVFFFQRRVRLFLNFSFFADFFAVFYPLRVFFFFRFYLLSKCFWRYLWRATRRRVFLPSYFAVKKIKKKIFHKKNKEMFYVGLRYLRPRSRRVSRRLQTPLHLHFSVALNNYFVTVSRADSSVIAVFAAGRYGYKNKKKRFYSSMQMMAYRLGQWLCLFVNISRLRFFFYFHGDTSSYRHRAFFSGFSRRFWSQHRVAALTFCARPVYNGCRRSHFSRTGRRVLVVV